MKYSLIDFATIYPGERPRAAFERSVRFAQHAEELGFDRIWYAEHHNMTTIASSQPAVLIAYVGSHTSSISLGAGGVMLPNHAPLIVAEQFGTLSEMFPGRIELGLGRAPGTDQQTLRAIRRVPGAADRFPQDVQELRGYFADEPLLSGVHAMPGAGTNVPIIILGSSLFGATLAAQLGLPYAFASHFTPAHLEEAVDTYRRTYQPSEQHPEPYVIAAVNVTAARTTEEAKEKLQEVYRRRVHSMVARGRDLSTEQLDQLVNSFAGHQVTQMLHYNAVGNPEEVSAYLDKFAKLSRADELMLSIQDDDESSLLESLDIVAQSKFQSPNPS
ncbi:LLM class flavin-dependent oxidoreductase [Corynebacterium glucuronolyticum]|uniref:LLM class flavin-dependent oxidoreductase n=1 Tax=Corynebacterium glucuronolyticum TaxID=39791 RepID=A0A7T4EHB4_9CORY|nr:LLM class flavin-dependent oxidoreductase [Corynebacterium glucuronolyticum]QQB47368.1 LLM class flavin-dependent oxidoreductase [Corynebacterium glucuronolyticum]WKD64299.1 Alkanal monooxygenase alpha chain [Corynebacterium glucuronolyticum DSM 44120]SMB78347.1 luciferase family oxidoreductase, group 1 [Corynebacterium glucuronolyticum]